MQNAGPMQKKHGYDNSASIYVKKIDLFMMSLTTHGIRMVVTFYSFIIALMHMM